MSFASFPAKKILVPTDLSATSKVALGFARQMHHKFGGEISVLHAHLLDLQSDEEETT
jgi:nucleotide-binding universal stress UspA family protein